MFDWIKKMYHEYGSFFPADLWAMLAILIMLFIAMWFFL